MSEQVHTVDQAAKRLKLHPKTVLRFIHDGRLRATRIGKSYRIQHSDLEGFAGAATGARTTQAHARVTSIVEVEQVSMEASERIASFLNAAIMSAGARPDPIHLNTAYDPLTGSLKIVVIGNPPDTAGLLHLVHMQLENQR